MTIDRCVLKGRKMQLCGRISLLADIFVIGIIA